MKTKILLASLLFSLTTKSQTINLSSDLVLCIPMNGNATDLSGNNNHGTVNGATLTTDRFGTPNSAYHFDGVNNYIEIPSSSSIENIESNDEVTITAWGNITNWYQNHNIFPFLAKHNINTDMGWDMSIANPIYNSGNDLTFISNYPAYYTTNANATFNNWDFYAIVFSKSNQQVKFYKNGALLTTINTSGSELENTGNGNLYIGFSPAGPEEYANGDIDEVKMYNRVLTDNEIQAIYSNTNSSCGSDLISNIVLCMPMNGNATDFSGNNNHGTVNGATLTNDRFGNPNSAYHFDGINNYIEIPSSSSIENIESNDEVTITAWGNINNWYQNHNIFPFLAKHNVNTDMGWDMSIANPIYNNGNDLTFISNYPTYYTTNASATFNNWDFYAIVFSKSNQHVKFYKNGVLLTTINTSGSELENTGNGNLYIGFSPAGPEEYTNGDIDEVKMYNRALTDNEIQAIFTQPFTCPLDFTTNIKENNSIVNTFSLYPNPATSSIELSLNDNLIKNINKEILISIYSNDGKLIRTRNILKSNIINNITVLIDDLTSGLYHVKITSSNYSQSLRFIKQ